MQETNTVTEAIAKDALSAVEFHPLHAEAISWGHCVSDVFAQPKSFIDRARISEEKESLFTKLWGASQLFCW